MNGLPKGIETIVFNIEEMIIRCFDIEYIRDLFLSARHNTEGPVPLRRQTNPTR